MSRFSFVLMLTFGVLITLTGCQRGPALGTVNGTIRVNGQPLPYAYVMFQPIDPPGAYGSAYANELGEYELQFSRSSKGALVGKHRVSIRAAGGEELDEQDAPLARVAVPARYNSATELERQVTAGSNVHDFDLEIPVTLTSAR